MGLKRFIKKQGKRLKDINYNPINILKYPFQFATDSVRATLGKDKPSSTNSFKERVARKRIASASAIRLQDVESQKGKGLQDSARKNVEGALDAVTQQELIGLSSPVAGESYSAATARMTKANALYKEAKEGQTAKFKSRVATQLQFEHYVDRPDASRLAGIGVGNGSILRK